MAEKKSAKTETKPAAKEKKDTAKASAKGAEKKSAKNQSKGKKANPVAKYFRDLRSEFKKVVWPSKETVLNNTGVVLMTMIITGAGVFVLDLAFAELFKMLMSLVGG